MWRVIYASQNKRQNQGSSSVNDVAMSDAEMVARY